ncbi:MAG: zinc-dependent alcohol dehydrogenase family protein [Pirellulaceae bacterium]|nr:zinc-dependent alcohol dehydrogenase family protein [Pirellulaceae bacterium]
MRAIVFEQFQQPLQVCDVLDPTPPADGVVISVAASGLCRSDWHGWMGHDPDIQLPHVPGHEFAGRVAEVGPEVTRWRVGDRVTVPFCVGCGACETCLQGDLQICDHYFQPGFTAWGAFAEYVAIPHADLNLVQLPEELAFDAAASLGCRMVTAFRAVVDQGRLQPDQWIAIFGCGGVGLSAVMIAKSLGAKVIGIDVQPSALQMAAQFGADYMIDPANEDPVDAIRDLVPAGVSVTIDALGRADICCQAIAALRKRGRHVQVGLLAGAEVSLSLDQVIAKELELLGSHGMSAQAYGPLLEMIACGKLHPERLIAEKARLDDLPRLLPRMGRNQHHGITVIELTQSD